MVKRKEKTIIIDTNILGEYESNGLFVSDYNLFSINNKFLSLITFLRENKVNHKLLIPDIVIKELINQEIERYQEELDNFMKLSKKFKHILDVSYNIPRDYRKILNKRVENFISEYDIELLTIPKEGLIEKLINKVLNREKPFYKTKKSKDSGFKDALIFESILEYTLSKKNLDIIFLTNDGDFSGLSEEIRYSGSENNILFSIKKDSFEFKKEIDEELKLNNEFKLIEELYTDNFKKGLHSNLQYIDLLRNSKKIHYRKSHYVLDLIDIRRLKEKQYIIYFEVRLGGLTTNPNNQDENILTEEIIVMNKKIELKEDRLELIKV